MSSRSRASTAAQIDGVGFDHEHIDPADIKQLPGSLAFHVQHQTADQVLVGQTGDPDSPRTGIRGHLDLVADLQPTPLGEHRARHGLAGKHPPRDIVRIAHGEIDRYALAIRQPLDQDHDGLVGDFRVHETQAAQSPDAGNRADFVAQFLRHLGRPASP